MDDLLTPWEPVSRRAWLAWALFLILIFLVLAAIGWQRTFGDTESWALYFAGQPFQQHLQAIRGDLVHPPLMYLVHRAWLGVFGHTDNAARALPLVIGLPAILLLTLLAARVTSHWRLLSFFLACTFFDLSGSAIQVRMYGLALLLTAASLLLWDTWRASPRNTTLAAWTAVMTLLIYTHLFGALLVASFLLLNWVFGKRKIAFTVAAAVPALAFLPWFLYVLPVYHARGLEPNLSWVHRSILSAAASFSYNFLGDFVSDSNRLRILATAAAVVVHLALLVLAWLNRARFWPLRGEWAHERQWFWMAILFAAVPLLSLFAFSLVVTRAFEARFVLGASIPYLIAIFLLCQLSARAGRIVLLCVLLPWRIVSVGTSVVDVRRPHFVRQGVLFVAGQVRPNDLLLAEDPGIGNALYWEWNRRLHRSEHIAALRLDSLTAYREPVITPLPLERLELAGVARIWLFRSKGRERPGLPEALAARGFIPAPRRTAGVPELLLFERKNEN